MKLDANEENVGNENATSSNTTDDAQTSSAEVGPASDESFWVIANSSGSDSAGEDVANATNADESVQVDKALLAHNSTEQVL